MNYSEARTQIQDGDLIAVLDVHGIIGHLTRLFTADVHTHTGVARWLDDRLFMADLNSGRNHLTAVSQLKEFDVCAPPAGLDLVMIRFAMNDWLAKPIEYGYLAFLMIGLKCMLKIKEFIHWRKIVVCSGGSVEIYEMAAALMRADGKDPPAKWIEHTRMLSPGELFSELPLKFQVRG